MEFIKFILGLMTLAWVDAAIAETKGED